jgi:NAD-dependent deacetylase sirtuin 2
MGGKKTDILKDNSIHSFIEYIKKEKCQNIIVMTGAGISTSAGIPDFRTPGTGLYDNLQKYQLPYPEAIFDISYFMRKPEPFFELSRELFPGLYKPTPCHHFIKLLQDQNVLLRNYTQNIDMLERLAKVEDRFLVEAHGSFHKARCVGFATLKETEEVEKKDDDLSDNAASAKEEVSEPNSPTSSTSSSDYSYQSGCGKEYTIEEFKTLVFENKIPKCECDGYIKPDIVFFGEQLPPKFHSSIERDFKKCDALIVMGTSLQVQPFCSLIDFVSPKTPRLLINREQCGVYRHPSRGFDFDHTVQKYRRDALFLGSCDEACRVFAEEMGWTDNFEKLAGPDSTKQGFDIDLLVKELDRVVKVE